jgi:hydroxypyruvate reductase
VIGGAASELELLERAYRSALEAAAPEVCLPSALEHDDRESPALVLGAGKAAAAMAAAFCAHWSGPVRGMVVTRYGHGLKAGERCPGIEVIEAGHPSPDGASLAAGARLLELASSARPGESVHCLISGGGSSLAAVPLPRITFAQKRAAADFLMRHGADIREINCVRKHLSGLKGGRLARVAHPARVTTYAISDIPGDNVADIASGPTIPDPTTQADAVRILEHYDYPAMTELRPVLGDAQFESPKPGDAGFRADTTKVIASAATALHAAAAYLQQQGYRVVYLGDDLAAEARALGREHAALAKRYAASGDKTAILSGGETRVVLGKGGGRGGRNLVYLAGLALELDGCRGIYALAADTDGIDGHGDHAGGMVTPDLLVRGAQRGVSLERLLAAHDTYQFFAACDLLIRTGPTRTNVNDFRLILCEP